jgi:hypothetical protein
MERKYGVHELSRQTQFAAIKQGGWGHLCHSPRSSAHGHQQEQKVVNPMSASFIRGTNHGDQGLLRTFN